jgi:4'-phosphopantetheinyl transferase
VDVEKLRPLPDAQALADRFFLPQESAALRPMAEPEQTAAFFNLWTCKEALAKATGLGLAQSLARFEVSGDADAGVTSVDGDQDLAAQWSLRTFKPAPGYVAAVAVRSPEARFCFRDLAEGEIFPNGEMREAGHARGAAGET